MRLRKTYSGVCGRFPLGTAARLLLAVLPLLVAAGCGVSVGGRGGYFGGTYDAAVTDASHSDTAQSDAASGTDAVADAGQADATDVAAPTPGAFVADGVLHVIVDPDIAEAVNVTRQTILAQTVSPCVPETLAECVYPRAIAYGATSVCKGELLAGSECSSKQPWMCNNGVMVLLDPLSCTESGCLASHPEAQCQPINGSNSGDGHDIRFDAPTCYTHHVSFHCDGFLCACTIDGTVTVQVADPGSAPVAIGSAQRRAYRTLFKHTCFAVP